MAWTGRGTALLKATRQQDSISTAFGTRGMLLSGLNVATCSRCPSGTWIPQHTPKQPGLWPGAGPVTQCIPTLDSPQPWIPVHTLGTGLNWFKVCLLPSITFMVSFWTRVSRTKCYQSLAKMERDTHLVLKVA